VTWSTGALSTRPYCENCRAAVPVRLYLTGLEGDMGEAGSRRPSPSPLHLDVRRHTGVFPLERTSSYPTQHPEEGGPAPLRQHGTERRRRPCPVAARKSCSGFDNWAVESSAGSYLALLADRRSDLVYLTADSEHELVDFKVGSPASHCLLLVYPVHSSISVRTPASHCMLVVYPVHSYKAVRIPASHCLLVVYPVHPSKAVRAPASHCLLITGT